MCTLIKTHLCKHQHVQPDNRNFKGCLKGAVTQIEKALINDCQHVSKVS